MKSMVQHLWLIPTLPLLAAGISALLKQRQRMLAASLAIGSMILSLALSGVAFANALHHPWQGEGSHQVVNFSWFEFAAGRMTRISRGSSVFSRYSPPQCWA